MAKHYRLYPPFLYVPEEQDFSKAWEHFCCKMLNVSNKTNEIYVRNPPEQGADIFYPSKKIAYQCKSVESGKSGDFNVTKAIDSIESAKKFRAEIGWDSYALCTNVSISGSAEALIKKALPEITILQQSCWVGLCESHPIEVERNFRDVIDVPRARIVDAIGDTFLDSYSSELIEKMGASSFDIFLYSNRYDKTYRMPVSQEFTCSDIIGVLRRLFRIPGPATISSENIRVSLRHSLLVDGKKASLSKTLGELGVSHGEIVTYWTTVIWEDVAEQFSGDVMHMVTSWRYSPVTDSIDMRKERAISKYAETIAKSFKEFDDSIL